MSWEYWPWRGEVHYELNYLISEETALRIREYVLSYLGFDEHSVGRPNFSYPVYSLYLDSEDLTLYRRAINDIEHRWQLRVRYYVRRSEAPADLEIKHRWAEVVTRHKCAVKQEAVPLVLAGQLLERRYLTSLNPLHLAALQKFSELMLAHKAKPKLHVAFQREGYISDDRTVRVTMDRQVVCQATLNAELKTILDCPRRLFQPAVLLELNYANRFPDWFRELVETFSLAECEADKYVEGISTLSQQALHTPSPFRRFPEARE